jgi:hypothetical protein
MSASTKKFRSILKKQNFTCLLWSISGILEDPPQIANHCKPWAQTVVDGCPGFFKRLFKLNPLQNILELSERHRQHSDAWCCSSRGHVAVIWIPFKMKQSGSFFSENLHNWKCSSKSFLQWKYMSSNNLYLLTRRKKKEKKHRVYLCIASNDHDLLLRTVLQALINGWAFREM